MLGFICSSILPTGRIGLEGSGCVTTTPLTATAIAEAAVTTARINDCTDCNDDGDGSHCGLLNEKICRSVASRCIVFKMDYQMGLYALRCIPM